jgi:hypothetical protein
MFGGAVTVRSRAWLRSVSVALAVLAGFPVFGLTSTTPVGNPCPTDRVCVPPALGGAVHPQALFSWSLTERLAVDAYGYGIPIETSDRGLRGSIVFDGCHSLSDASGVAEYRWTVDDGTRTTSYLTGPHCRLSLPRSAANGTWTVGLTVASRDGVRAMTTQAVHFRDLLIASLGDSAASGEGNPDAPAGAGRSARWVDPRCHRSDRAASAQVARQLASEPHTSVTFWHLACSGARIISDTPDDRRGGGVLSPYDAEPPEGGGDHTPLPSQLEQLRLLARARHRHVDALLLTIGANDMRLAEAWADCYVERIKVLASCEQKWGPILRQRLTLLPARYDQLGAALRGGRLIIDRGQRLVLEDGTPIARPEIVFLTEYFNPSEDDRQRFWSNGDGFSWYCPRDPLVPGPKTRRWGYDTALEPLNAEIGRAAVRNHWRLVSGIAEKFRAHGYCASDSWIRSLSESILQQGGVSGSWHPNAEGQGVVASALLAALISALDLSQHLSDGST